MMQPLNRDDHSGDKDTRKRDSSSDQTSESPEAPPEESRQHYTTIRPSKCYDPNTKSPRPPSSPNADRTSQNDWPSRMGSRRIEDIIPDAERQELVRVATSLSRCQSNVADTTNLECLGVANSHDHDYDLAMDPLSPRFDLHKWAQNFTQQLHGRGHHQVSTGVIYKNLSVYGSGAALQLQPTVGSVFTSVLRPGDVFSFGRNEPRQILHSFDGMLCGGEMLVVLGRPGSGCSTLLKSLCGELHGLSVDNTSTIQYGGIPQSQMKKEFKGEVIYNQEVDKHFPHLTVGQTLEFAASVRTPSHRIQNMSRGEYCRYIARVVMAVCGLNHTYNTKVGNDFIRGVSGGERKRVSIAEMILAGSPFSAWDNSTRGLDAATALKFVQTLRLSSDLGRHSNVVAIYQASQTIYDIFDKVTVLYEGRQIYFGSTTAAKDYFLRQGWYCPPRQTTGDFLTSVTNPQERKAREGMESKVPRTPEEFERYWRLSPEYNALMKDIGAFERGLRDKGDETISQFRQQKNYEQAKHVRPKSPYRISLAMQVRLNTKRAYQRTWNDISATMIVTVVNTVMALIIGSVFYGTPDATAGFYAKGSVLFMAILLNALTAITEISTLYAQRPIVEKHSSYAFYHPATEAAAGVLADIPVKFVTATVLSLVIYFMAGLRRQPAQFFLFFLINYVSIFIMIALFRTMAAITSSVSQAMTLAAVLVLALVIYTGFFIPVSSMHPWFSWIRWINPIYYAFEILVANEFHGRDFTCSNVFPPYSPPVGDSWTCVALGAVPGKSTVSGDDFIAANYGYSYSHVWRNFGILIGFLLALMAVYFMTTEINSATSSTAEALVFQRGHVPPSLQKSSTQRSKDMERPTVSTQISNSAEDTEVKAIPAQRDIFTWRDVVYDIKIKEESRRLLDHVAGWVKPGTLTALMGVSGAGKTTLLDVLAQRISVGVVTGNMLVNGQPLDASFQRNTGYVQQQDLHLQTATVRESLRFSARLRQPKSVSKKKKHEFVEEVIRMLNMEDFANAVVGVPGEGLNVEQRKRLTIGVELVAKPKLLLFLDEPTSGLDSQSSRAICIFLKKLAEAGQAVLCTVHQPSAILFQEFDRLLFLAKGGKTVYFGEIGANSRILLDCFESHGAQRRCGDTENPAEYMLEMVNAGTNSHGEDWHSVWELSNERKAVDAEIERIHTEKQAETRAAGERDAASTHSEFAMPMLNQVQVVSARVFQQYWRMPSYIFSKWLLGITAGLFIGFSFYQVTDTLAGTQNAIFAVFMLTTMFTTLVQQIQPLFVTQRELYEVRERPSKAYSWKAFLIANIIVEIPFQIVTGVLIYACFYFPVFGAGQSPVQQGLILLLTLQLFLYASAFADMTVAALPNAQAAGGIVIFLTLMSTLFCGVMQSPTALPGFWIFMYRVSPFTYWVGGIVSTALHGRKIDCSPDETASFDPPPGLTCGEYLSPILSQAPGVLQNPMDTQECRYCPYNNADQYIAVYGIVWSERWRNFGIVWAYIAFDIAVTVVVYYLFRVRTVSSRMSGLRERILKLARVRRGLRNRVERPNGRAGSREKGSGKG